MRGEEGNPRVEKRNKKNRAGMTEEKKENRRGKPWIKLPYATAP